MEDAPSCIIICAISPTAQPLCNETDFSDIFNTWNKYSTNQHNHIWVFLRFSNGTAEGSVLWWYYTASQGNQILTFQQVLGEFLLGSFFLEDEGSTVLQKLELITSWHSSYSQRTEFSQPHLLIDCYFNPTHSEPQLMTYSERSCCVPVCSDLWI
jgi:hypothetical protein